MLGVLLKAFPLRPLNKRREKRRERETINLRTEKKKKKNGSREDSLSEATGDLMFVH